MPKQIVTATFIGQNGSCGYITGHAYMLVIEHKKGFNIKIHIVKGDGYCRYSSIISFLQNWDDIKVFPSVQAHKIIEEDQEHHN